MNFLTGVDLPENPVVARLMTRQYVEALNEFRETDVYIGGLMILAGFTQVQHYVTKGHKKETTYTPTKKIVTAFNAIASLSSKPLLYIFYLGLLISLVAFVASVRLIVIHFFYYESIPGWLSIVTSVWLIQV